MEIYFGFGFMAEINLVIGEGRGGEGVRGCKGCSLFMFRWGICQRQGRVSLEAVCIGDKYEIKIV